MKKNIGRPKAFDEQEALTIAMNYFWEHGYNKSSLSGLLEAMNIKKSSFYQTFKSKENIFRLSLELYAKMSYEYMQELKKEMGAKGVLLHLVYETIKELKETGKVNGCLLANSAGECFSNYPHFNELISYKFKTFRKLFKELIEEAQKQGDIKNSLAPSTLGSIYQSLINGLVQMIQLGASKKELNDVVKHIEEILS